MKKFVEYNLTDIEKEIIKENIDGAILFIDNHFIKEVDYWGKTNELWEYVINNYNYMIFIDPIDELWEDIKSYIGHYDELMKFTEWHNGCEYIGTDIIDGDNRANVDIRIIEVFKLDEYLDNIDIVDAFHEWIEYKKRERKGSYK